MAGVKQRFFFDTNVLVDVLEGQTRPSFNASMKLFQAARKGLFEAFITTQSIIDAEYICHHSPGREASDFYKKMLFIMSFVNVIQIDWMSIREALKNPAGDFEDTAQFILADSDGLDAIVTNDRHFIARQSDSGIMMLTPEELIAKMS